MSEPLSPQYEPGVIEKPLFQEWEEQGYFRAHEQRVLDGEREPYVIVIPPPNVTAVLHMGHGLNNTLQDVLTRWRRMQGREALYLPGTDHAGIATQNVVERLIATEGKTRNDLGREAFVERVWTFVDETGSTILQQLRAIGCSCDWTRTRFTLEPGLSRAVREVFVRLYEKDLIYRGNYIINWCPRCLTALSDEEAEAEETNGKLYHLRYPIAGDAPSGFPMLPDGRAYIVVATTRPETMLGDTAVAVHPDDARYAGIVGRSIALPLTDRMIPIVADSFVDPEFGSGAVKITPAHDPNDFDMSRRQNIPALNVLTPDAKMNDAVPATYRGLDRFDARKRVVKDFEAAGLLEKIVDHVHSVPHCYRCDTVVEPRLSEQWFVKMKPLAEPAAAASRDGSVRFTPDRWTKVYDNWLENIRDWCISRQLWWGHRIPVWYCRADGCSEMIVSREDPTRCTKCGSAALEQDPDVLDTWFSSWLWPFSTLGWPDETPDLEAFYPTNTLVTAPEILFFWVARMIMAGIEFMGELPFTEVYLTGTVRDVQGRKMSKSLGNGIDPLEVVELYGADALRYTVTAGAGLGTDVHMDPSNLETTFASGRNFANKVWNAGRFALMNIDAAEVPAVSSITETLELADRWILSRLDAAADDVTRHLEAFRFQEAAMAGYHFFRDELADWYLELIKPRMIADASGANASATDATNADASSGNAGSAASRRAAEATLVAALDGILRLLHPIMPFITDALWRRLPRVAGASEPPSIMIAAWPASGIWRDAEAEMQMNALIELIGAIRTLRAEYDVTPGKPIPIQLRDVHASLDAALEAEERAVRRMGRVASIVRDASSNADNADSANARETTSANAKADANTNTNANANANADAGNAGAHAVLRGGSELFIPLADLVDIAQERDRLQKELDRVDGMLKSTEAKLGNAQFTDRAPPEVIEREREKASTFRDQRERLSSKLMALR